MASAETGITLKIKQGEMILEIPHHDPLAWIVQKWIDCLKMQQFLQDEELLKDLSQPIRWPSDGE